MEQIDLPPIEGDLTTLTYRFAILDFSNTNPCKEIIIGCDSFTGDTTVCKHSDSDPKIIEFVDYCRSQVDIVTEITEFEDL